MVNLETNWMGLKLKNPIVAGSSGLSNSIENVTELDRNGVGAIILKSLFEEQIRQKVSHSINESDAGAYYPEAEDYIREYTHSDALTTYLDFIRNSKMATGVPIIASINCLSDSDEWVNYAQKIESVGADALELNVFVLPSDINRKGEDNERVYFNIVEKVLKVVNIPVSLKISYYFSGLAEFVTRLSWTGIKNLTLFNRFFSPDIDIETLEVKSSFVFSSPSDIATSLRWVAMLSPHVNCDISASTGVHDGEGVIKQLLAGAKTVQTVSTLYKNGVNEISDMLDTLTAWMKKHDFENIDEFRGRLSVKSYDNPAAYERVQFMKYFSGID